MKIDNIICIILFGSKSVDRISEYSDIDVCIFTRKHDNLDYEEQIKKDYNLHQVNNISIVKYTVADFRKMLKKGSLFLWHLKLEGTILHGKDFFISQISNLKKYNDHRVELQYIQEIIQQELDCYNETSKTCVLDFSLLFSLVRNTCIVLCDFLNNPRFGKFDCLFFVLNKYPDFSFSINTYNALYNYKVIYEKNFEFVDPQISILNFPELISEVKSAVADAQNIIANK